MEIKLIKLGKLRLEMVTIITELKVAMVREATPSREQTTNNQKEALANLKVSKLIINKTHESFLK